MIKKEYKTSGIKILKFVCVFLIADFVLGSLASQIFFSQTTGKYARATHAIEETNAKILVFGSSHAHRHYVPKVLENELNKKCFNAGAEGQQLLYHTALQEMILNRTKPDLIILNIDENFLYTSKIAYDRLSDLHPYYEDHRDVLRPILGLKSKLVDFKLFFKSYQMNSTIIHALRYHVSPQKDYDGYRPLFNKIKSEEIALNDPDEAKEYVEFIDDNFITALKTFITNAKNKNIKLVFVTSPTFNNVDHSKNKSFTTIKKIAFAEDIPLIDFFNSIEFRDKRELFHDFSHLNNDGAELFTKRLADRLKNMEMVGP